MKAVYVTDLGAFTPVGVNVPQTMGSLLARLQWFDDLDVFGVTGEPLSGARVRLSAVEDATDRYVGMARFALAECRQAALTTRSVPEPVPLLLATSHARDLPCEADRLLDLVLDADDEARASGRAPLDRRTSRIFAEGRTGALRAIAAAQELVASGRASTCYVGAVDSLLDPVRLNELLDDGRLLDGSGAEGLIPGEAAVVIRLEGRATSGGGTILGAATTDEPASATSGSGLARASTEALRLAHVGASSLSTIAHDASSEPAVVEELAMALCRLPFDGGVDLRPWAPALSVGETGAAAALLTIAMTTFFLRERIFAGPALVWLTSETGARAALVMGPTEGKEPPRG